MARRRNEDEPERPYRWADTPVDPLGSRRIRGPRSKRAWLTWAVVIVIVGVLVFINWRQTGSSSSRPSPSVPVTLGPPITSPPSTSPPPQEVVAAPMGTPQRSDGLQITATGNVTSRRQGINGDEVLVTTTVTIVNTTAERVSLSALDWELQFPEGRITPATPTLSADELNVSDALAPGGTVTGTVSFDITGGTPGEYEIHYLPMIDPSGGTQLGWSFVLG